MIPAFFVSKIKSKGERNGQSDRKVKIELVDDINDVMTSVTDMGEKVKVLSLNRSMTSPTKMTTFVRCPK